MNIKKHFHYDKESFTKAIRVVKNVSATENELHYFGIQKMPVSHVAFLESIDRLRENGKHEVAFMMLDIKTLCGASYNPALSLCTQSIIKAIYSGAFLDGNYGRFEENQDRLKKILAYSDNYLYETLFQRTGSEPVFLWSKQLGINFENLRFPYPSMSVQTMLLLWLRLFLYLSDGEDNVRIADYMVNSLASAAALSLGKKYLVLSKAGWEDDPQSKFDSTSCNDSGIVFSQTGPYIFVIFTDIPYEIPDTICDVSEIPCGAMDGHPLLELVEAMDRLHSEMTEGSLHFQ